MSSQGAGRERVPPLRGWRRVSIPASASVLVAVTVGTGLDLPGRPVWVVAVAAAALLIVVTGVGWVVLAGPAGEAQVVVALAASGLAGVFLALLHGAPGFVAVCLALAGLSQRLPLIPALVAGLIVLIAMNLALLLAPGNVSAPVVADQDVAAAFFFAVGVFVRSARIAQEAARAAQARAEGLLAKLRVSQAAQAEAAALAERTRVAREIHDILAHALSGLVLALDTMELLGRQAGTDPDVGAVARMLEQVARAQRIARDGLADTRRAVAALRGDELPGPALLDRLVAETSAATGIRAALTVSGERRPLPPEVGLALYRTAQEALINTAKYAGRHGRAELRLSYHGHGVELEIEDARADDARPPGAAALTFGGYGLTGLRERAELLGGTLTAGPTGSGFRVLLRLPAGPAPDPASRPPDAGGSP